MGERIKQAQLFLKSCQWSGWLLYDFRKTNDLACKFLEIPSERMLTRRFFYWIPSEGVPTKIVHSIESSILEHLPGKMITYSSWEELERVLKEVLKGHSKVAMEYSKNNAIPYISKVDAGTVDLIRSFGVEVISSADILQQYTSVWSEQQLLSHLNAAAVLDNAVSLAWDWISYCLNNQYSINEKDVQDFLLKNFEEQGCICNHPPICAVNAHSADPHYALDSTKVSKIQPGDFILIDLWCKKKVPFAVYADITRVGVAASRPTEKQMKIFNLVRKARNRAVALLSESLRNEKPIRGWEIDQACREVIEEAGYGPFFIHRTGHNIGEEDHGDGANIDNYETKEIRMLLPGTCFSIEPGIYLPGEFGVRLEYDIYLEKNTRDLRITGGIQEEIVTLMTS